MGFCRFGFLVVWLHNLVLNKPFCSWQKLNDYTLNPWGGDGIAVNMLGQHVCVCGFLPPLASDMVYRVVRQGSEQGVHTSLRLRPALVLQGWMDARV
jgi:hypothetical protein